MRLRSVFFLALSSAHPLFSSLNLIEIFALSHAVFLRRSRLPAGGFAALNPKFSVEVNPSESPEHHPTAHTCFNQLCLPGTYASKEELKKKLKVSIREGKGFGFI